jgi:hypothetical protein
LATNTSTLLALLALLLSCLVTWRSIFFRRKTDRQAERLRKANETLADYEQRLSSLEKRGKQYDTFQESLNLAEITTKLQGSRLSAQQYNRDMSPPERYRYVHSLASGGMSSQEIASILSISIHEADQLVNLARLAHRE